MNIDTEVLRSFFVWAAVIMVVCGVLAVGFLAIALIQLRRISVPPGAGFAETMLYVPLTLVLFLDLLDLALDLFSAPVSWIILSKLGLPGLRGVTAVEALLPFTQALPTMTAAWIGVRVLGRDRVLAQKFDSYTTIEGLR